MSAGRAASLCARIAPSFFGNIISELNFTAHYFPARTVYNGISSGRAKSLCVVKTLFISNCWNIKPQLIIFAIYMPKVNRHWVRTRPANSGEQRSASKGSTFVCCESRDDTRKGGFFWTKRCGNTDKGSQFLWHSK